MMLGSAVPALQM